MRALRPYSCSSTWSHSPAHESNTKWFQRILNFKKKKLINHWNFYSTEFDKRKKRIWVIIDCRKTMKVQIPYSLSKLFFLCFTMTSYFVWIVTDILVTTLIFSLPIEEKISSKASWNIFCESTLSMMSGTEEEHASSYEQIQWHWWMSRGQKSTQHWSDGVFLLRLWVWGKK